jgi:general secretion pathway protein L
MPQRILSLDIDDSELKAAVVQTSFRDYKVSGLFREPLNGDADAQLKRFVEQHAEAGDTILSALPGDRVTWRTFFLPFRDQKKLAQTVPFELESSVPFGLDEVVVDYQVLQRDRAGTTVLAALVPKEVLEAHLERLQRIGADPKVVDVGPLATLNTLSLVPDLPPTYAFLDFGPRSITVALYRERTLAGLRTLGRHLAPAGGNGAAPPPADDETVNEVRWTLLALNGAPLDDDLICYVAGDPAAVTAIESSLAQTLPATVRRLDRVKLGNLPADIGAKATAFSPSLGLALREVAPAALGVNFRRGEFTFQRGQEEMRSALRTVVILGVVVLLLTVLDMFVKYQQLQGQVSGIEAQIQKIFANTLPDAGRVPNPKGTLQEETDALRQRVDLVSDVVPVSTSTSIDILRAAASAVPTKVRIDCEDYAMDPNEVRLRCNTDTYESVDQIRDGLLKTGFFSDVEVKDAKNSPKGGGIDFRIVMRLNKEARAHGGPAR